MIRSVSAGLVIRRGTRRRYPSPSGLQVGAKDWTLWTNIGAPHDCGALRCDRALAQGSSVEGERPSRTSTTCVCPSWGSPAALNE